MASEGVRKLLSSMWTGDNAPEKAVSIASGRSTESGRSTPSSSSPVAEPVVDNTPRSRSPDPPVPGSPKDVVGGSLRRNYTADALSAYNTFDGTDDKGRDSSPSGLGGSSLGGSSSGGSSMRRNTSSMELAEIRRREASAQGSMALQGSRTAVIEAVACELLIQILGEAAGRAAMKESVEKKKEAAAPAAPQFGNPGSSRGSSSEHAPASTGGGPSTDASQTQQLQQQQQQPQAAAVAAPAEKVSFPKGISDSLQHYILTIVRHLELPNSCIVASLIYVQRAVAGRRFALSLTNWQPCLLAAFVIAAKLSFDEPVWNEDFVKALRISNVQVCQISRWEADFLQLIHFNTNVDVSEYASAIFLLQKTHESLHGHPCHFFTFLMSLSKAT